MARRILLWAMGLAGGLTAGGAALWWMLNGEEPLGVRAVESGGTRVVETEDVGAAVKPAPPPTDYIGSQNCRECHRELWDSYQTHAMSHSVFPAGATSPAEDFEHNTTFTAGPCQYRVERTDGVVRHHETALDSAGETIYDQAVEIQYAVGSAKRGRSYFIDR